MEALNRSTAATFSDPHWRRGDAGGNQHASTYRFWTANTPRTGTSNSTSRRSSRSSLRSAMLRRRATACARDPRAQQTVLRCEASRRTRHSKVQQGRLREMHDVDRFGVYIVISISEARQRSAKLAHAKAVIIASNLVLETRPLLMENSDGSASGCATSGCLSQWPLALAQHHTAPRRQKPARATANVLPWCVWDRTARWPGSPSPREIALELGLIPVDSAGETVGVGSEGSR